ncbi:MAG: glycerol-3-phosphate 1-O-acyltransferase PlsY [Campylobacter sp.]|nr:glycerol-3-phosphate 1-O-acyltransferase PlsY [Campylobacter sp.]
MENEILLVKFFKIIVGILTNPNSLACIIAYLVGAIPFGLLIAKKFAHLDIKSEGSKSIGATNVLRVLKAHNSNLAKKLAIATIICDVLKGVVPILIARYILELSLNTQLSMAVFAVLGHCFSPYLKFEGGKGVATGAGVLGLFLPLELGCALIVWFVVAKVFKISSVASLFGLLTLVLIVLIFRSDELYLRAPVLGIAFMIFYKHIPNIKRLIFKQEGKVI